MPQNPSSMGCKLRVEHHITPRQLLGGWGFLAWGGGFKILSLPTPQCRSSHNSTQAKKNQTPLLAPSLAEKDFVGEYLRRARTARYFSNVFTRKGLAVTHLPKCPLRRDNPWVLHAGADLRGRDLQRATNNICSTPHLARSGAQSMDGLMDQLSAIFQLKSITD